MKNLLLVTLTLLSFRAQALPHLDLEMSSDEYRSHLKKISKSLNQEIPDPEITEAIQLGDRLSKWIQTINSSRPEASAIRLTSALTRRGVPIDSPSIYSPSIIRNESKKILAGLPENMRRILTTSEAFPLNTGMDDESFIKFARLVDKNYQNAARYKSVNLYRAAYIHAGIFDVRGYYYLKQNKITQTTLGNVASLGAEKVKLIKEALSKVCMNSNRETLLECRKLVDLAHQKKELASIYTKYIARSEEIWNDFFVIPYHARRSDVSWSQNTMVVPFNTPSIAKFTPYLKNNIEDEFRFKEWKLKMNFGVFPDGPELIFQAGVVPHVNGLGGNQIVMDSNQPIEEYESQWTIRHEYGHVLGLPDCYHEFYDTTLNAYVNYQLDTTDLMCSRAGNMKERIFTELKKAYGKLKR